MFSRLMLQRNEFFELLAAHSDRVVAGANATLRLMNGLGNSTEDIPLEAVLSRCKRVARTIEEILLENA